MKFKNPLLVVKDSERTKKFYKEVLGLRVVMDFGANFTLTGGVSFQTEDTWKVFIDKTQIEFGAYDAELYFEEDDFDGFIKKLQKIEDVRYVHGAKEHAWGQRVVRILDPDNHIVEIGENMKNVCKRFVGSGMSREEIAARMDVPVNYVENCLNR